MSAISGTLRTYSALRDGTLRIVIDVDDQYKATFHEHFREIDVPVGIAPLVPDFERLPAPGKPKGGPLCSLAARWCNEPDFIDFAGAKTPEEAAQWVRNLCGVTSRAELDHDPEAGQLFKSYVRQPYMDWLKGKGG